MRDITTTARNYFRPPSELSFAESSNTVWPEKAGQKEGKFSANHHYCPAVVDEAKMKDIKTAMKNARNPSATAINSFLSTSQLSLAAPSNTVWPEKTSQKEAKFSASAQHWDDRYTPAMASAMRDTKATATKKVMTPSATAKRNFLPPSKLPFASASNTVWPKKADQKEANFAASPLPWDYRYTPAMADKMNRIKAAAMKNVQTPSAAKLASTSNIMRPRKAGNKERKLSVKQQDSEHCIYTPEMLAVAKMRDSKATIPKNSKSQLKSSIVVESDASRTVIPGEMRATRGVKATAMRNVRPSTEASALNTVAPRKAKKKVSANSMDSDNCYTPEMLAVAKMRDSKATARKNSQSEPKPSNKTVRKAARTGIACTKQREMIDVKATAIRNARPPSEANSASASNAVRPGKAGNDDRKLSAKLPDSGHCNYTPQMLAVAEMRDSKATVKKNAQSRLKSSIAAEVQTGIDVEKKENRAALHSPEPMDWMLSSDSFP